LCVYLKRNLKSKFFSDYNPLSRTPNIGVTTYSLKRVVHLKLLLLHSTFLRGLRAEHLCHSGASDFLLLTDILSRLFEQDLFRRRNFVFSISLVSFSLDEVLSRDSGM
jgi:hypothetical protein